MTGIGCLIITDGRGEYLEQMWGSLQWDGPDLFPTVLVDDSGDDEYGRFAHELIGPDIFVHHSHRRGLAGAIQSGWNALGDVDYILHLEEDFTFPDPIPLVDMLNLLHQDPNLAQVCLKRNAALTPVEQTFGGFIEANPDLYTEHDNPTGPPVTLHHECFSFNPCLYPAWVRDGGAGVEADVTKRLTDGFYHFGIYGRKFDPPRCVHIGDRRSNGWKP